MPAPITAGIDGTDHGLTAADWAAAEAARRGATLRLVHAWMWRPLDVPVAGDAEIQQKWAEDVLKEAEQRVTAAHPELEVATRLVPDDAVPALVAETARAGLLVLGSRGHSVLVGHFIGSVALRVLRQAVGPVVLVRRPREDDAGCPGSGEVVVGVPDVEVEAAAPALDLAFETAAARGARVRAVRAWTIPPLFAWSAGSYYLASEAGGLEQLEQQRLADLVRPWRERHPRIDVVEHVELGGAAEVLLTQSRHASLLVLGRHATGEHHAVRRIGSVTHAALHHAPCPVAVAAPS